MNCMEGIKNFANREDRIEGIKSNFSIPVKRIVYNNYYKNTISQTVNSIIETSAKFSFPCWLFSWI